MALRVVAVRVGRSSGLLDVLKTEPIRLADGLDERLGE